MGNNVMQLCGYSSVFVCTAWGIMLCNCVDIAVSFCVQHGE